MRNGIILLSLLALLILSFYLTADPIFFKGISIIIIIAIILMIVFAKMPLVIKSHWQTFLDGFQISSDEFYTLVKEGLKERQITPNIGITQESFLEKNILSAKRIYLRVSQDEYVFYICCAPYGTGTFVSSWLCIQDEKLIYRIPILGKLAERNHRNKTFYQMDTEAMFQSSVHTTVIAAVDSITEAKGKRGLSEFQTQFKEIK